ARAADLFKIGKYDEAIETWSSVVPSLKNGQQVQELIDAVKAARSRRDQAADEARVAAEKQEQKFAAPQGLEAALRDSMSRSESEAGAARSQKIKSDAEAAKNQAGAQSAYEKGKAFYDAGKTGEALREWNALVPSLENADAIKASLDSASTQFADAE